MASVYDVGDLVRVSVAFTDFSAAATDPTGVTFSYRLGAATATDLVYGVDGGLVKDSTGSYHVDISLTDDGWWYYRWVGTGAVVAASEGEILVQASHFV